MRGQKLLLRKMMPEPLQFFGIVPANVEKRETALLALSR
jgi:hypothetical protein